VVERRPDRTLRRHRPPAPEYLSIVVCPPALRQNEEYTMWYLLLLPFIGLLWVPFYNRELPALFGFPFFYWYQFAWVFLTALIIWIVYRHDLRKGVE
jgi:hypothetical protein